MPTWRSDRAGALGLAPVDRAAQKADRVASLSASLMRRSSAATPRSCRLTRRPVSAVPGVRVLPTRAAAAPSQMREPSCPLRREIVSRADAALAEAKRAGRDWRVIELLILAVPRDLPAAVLLAVRDGSIRAIGSMLAAAMPGASAHQLARLIAAAGATLDSGHRTAARELPMLTAAELAAVEAEITAILPWSRRRHDGTRWPRWRQIFAILGA